MASVNPEFLINPSFRLTTRYLSVAWHEVDPATVAAEGVIPRPGRTVVRLNDRAEVIAEFHADRLDMIYHALTDFSSPTLQERLRLLMRDVIFRRANEILPTRVRYWEERHNLRGKGVKIMALKKNILGCCTHDNEIHLPPYLVIFKEEWMDGVILHEMAHYLHKHHRRPFWDFLSTLLGTDSRLAKVKDEIALSPYYDYYCYLTR